jgi:hypothetical protein
MCKCANVRMPGANCLDPDVQMWKMGDEMQ